MDCDSYWSIIIILKMFTTTVIAAMVHLLNPVFILGYSILTNLTG